MYKTVQATALESLQKHTGISLDALDVSLVQQIRPEAGLHFFDQITGNQVITLWAFQALPSESQKKLIKEAVELASELRGQFEKVEEDTSKNMAGLVIDILVSTVIRLSCLLLK